MISYQQALDFLIKDVKPLAATQTALQESLGFILAEDIISKQMVPSFDNAAMDGYAVVCKDIANATAQSPVKLKITGQVAAGDDSLNLCGKTGMAVEIMTGAPIPVGFDGVVKIEDIELDLLGNILINKAIPLKNNIRDKGQDFQINDKVCFSGDMIKPNTIMALSTLGMTKVLTYAHPKVGIVTTGKELVSASQKELKNGMIRDCNGPFLKSMLSELALSAHDYGSMPDDCDLFKAKLKEIDNDGSINIMLSTGAVSKGRWDFIPEALKSCNANIIFHRVNIKPGKPILYAQLKNGTHFFGLPGNPMAVAVGFRFFVYPLIRALQGLSQEQPLYGVIEHDFNKNLERVDFLKSKVIFDPSGCLKVNVLTGQESFKVSSVLNANAWAVADMGAKAYTVGERLKIYPCMPNALFAISDQLPIQTQIKVQKNDRNSQEKNNQTTTVRRFSTIF